MKTIAQLYDSVLDVGGVESHLLSLLRCRDAKQFPFVIFSAVSERFEARVRPYGARIVSFERRAPLDPGFPLWLARSLKRERIDLVHAHSPTAALWGRVAAHRAGIPAVVTIHLPVSHYHGSLVTPRARAGRRLYTFLDRWLNHLPGFTRRLIYVSQADRDRDLAGRHAPPGASLVIPNGINLGAFAGLDRNALRDRFGLDPGTRVIILVGRLDAQKGVDDLLEAAARLPSEPPFRLWLVGDGPLAGPLKRRAESPDLRGLVDFWGWQDEVVTFLGASDIFVLPSHYEGMSVALLEAQAAGLPCVVTGVGASGTLVEEGVNGYVVPPGDIEGLAGALRALLSNSGLCRRMSGSARESSRQFDETILTKQVEQVYNQCLAGESKALSR